MVILNGMEIKDRKFFAPETGQYGRLLHFPGDYHFTPPIKELLISVPETTSLWSCTSNLVEAQDLNSVLVLQVLLFPQS